MRIGLSGGTIYLREVGGGGWGAPRREDAMKNDEVVVSHSVVGHDRYIEVQEMWCWECVEFEDPRLG